MNAAAYLAPTLLELGVKLFLVFAGTVVAARVIHLCR